MPQKSLSKSSSCPPEERDKVVAFTRHLPNEETMAAMKEAEQPEKLERFESAADLFDKLGIKS